MITGIDANPQARDAIAAGGNFEASIAQARWVGGNRHKGCVTTEIILHGPNCTL